MTALGLEGHRVDEASKAQEGLKRLREARYKLVTLPGPRMWVLGSLRETDLLADMLRLCGVESKE